MKPIVQLLPFKRHYSFIKDSMHGLTKCNKDQTKQQAICVPHCAVSLDKTLQIGDNCNTYTYGGRECQRPTFVCQGPLQSQIAFLCSHDYGLMSRLMNKKNGCMCLRLKVKQTILKFPNITIEQRIMGLLSKLNLFSFAMQSLFDCKTSKL